MANGHEYAVERMNRLQAFRDAIKASHRGGAGPGSPQIGSAPTRKQSLLKEIEQQWQHIFDSQMADVHLTPMQRSGLQNLLAGFQGKTHSDWGEGRRLPSGAYVQSRNLSPPPGSYEPQMHRAGSYEPPTAKTRGEQGSYVGGRKIANPERFRSLRNKVWAGTNTPEERKEFDALASGGDRYDLYLKQNQLWDPSYQLNRPRD